MLSVCGVSIVVVRELPKLKARVRFSYPAPKRSKSAILSSRSRKQSPYEHLQIDIIIEESLRFNLLKKNKITKLISGVRIPVVSIEDLIAMKKKANRDQDIMDLKALIELKGL
ncbi:MAG: hypothetical protein ACD_51C00028G0040 [uncultured bacterium]|nr:MAG: hypothetical protein ACD_51C00028G0040 [uncultured bacterium]